MEDIATALVADDDVTAQALMQVSLSSPTMHVTVVGDGAAALREHERSPFDLIMLDVDMPVMGGLEACRRLRSIVGPSLPIVIVTGMDDADSINAAYAAGATDFLAKPVPWALVGHRARYLLRNYRTYRALQRSEANTEALLSALPDPCLEVDSFGYIVAFHAPFLIDQAARRQALVGKNIYEALSHEGASALSESMREALTQGIARRRVAALNLDGNSRAYELSVARKAPDPSAPSNFVVLARDVSERVVPGTPQQPLARPQNV